MNWLAHLYLSESHPEVRLGNLLPDLVPASVLASLPETFQRGIRQHRQIDAWTDTHPIVRRSVRRFHPPLRRYAGILCDIFYDHFLAQDWDVYSSVPLSTFIQGVYASFDRCRSQVPGEAHEWLDRIRANDWLSSYRELSGVRRALERLSGRLRRPMDLSLGVSALEADYGPFQSDFREFFPNLAAHFGPAGAGAGG